jgi:DoxX-like family
VTGKGGSTHAWVVDVTFVPIRRSLQRGHSERREDAVKKSASNGLTKRQRIVYRTATGLVLAVMVFSIINFVFNDHFPFPDGPEGAFVHLGLPGWFKAELTVAKILGVLALLLPGIPHKLKEFAYFGFAITLGSASLAHFARGDAGLSVFFVLDPLVFLGMLIVSYFYFEKSHSPARADS